MNIWCLNCNTGDKYTGRKWKDYYNIDTHTNAKSPNFGHFEVGTIVGVLIDLDRGIINFFKDGNDLGQAFVQTEIKDGFLYPFL